MTGVVNCKHSRYDVYIGRPSKWGNPFKIGEHGTRDEVIEMYRQYINNHPTLKLEVAELRGKVLGCHCAPKRCHGDVLYSMANNLFDLFS